jgi:hypothetical protein
MKPEGKEAAALLCQLAVRLPSGKTLRVGLPSTSALSLVFGRVREEMMAAAGGGDTAASARRTDGGEAATERWGSEARFQVLRARSRSGASRRLTEAVHGGFDLKALQLVPAAALAVLEDEETEEQRQHLELGGGGTSPTTASHGAERLTVPPVGAPAASQSSMDPSDKVVQTEMAQAFCSFSGVTDEATARRLLAAASWDVQRAVDLFFESGGDIAAPPHSTAAGAATTTRGGESAAAAAGLSGVVGRPALSRGAAAPSFEDGLQPALDAHSDGNVGEVGSGGGSEDLPPPPPPPQQPHEGIPPGDADSAATQGRVDSRAHIVNSSDGGDGRHRPKEELDRPGLAEDRRARALLVDWLAAGRLQHLVTGAMMIHGASSSALSTGLSGMPPTPSFPSLHRLLRGVFCTRFHVQWQQK